MQRRERGSVPRLCLRLRLQAAGLLMGGKGGG